MTEEIVSVFSASTDAVAGWGLKPTTVKARAYVAKRGLPYWALEDGFLRSVGMGQRELPLSIVVDDVGIYYDSRSPSRLEQLIPVALDVEQCARAQRLIAAWRAARVSKYNHQTAPVPALPRDFVLVVDQTLGDAAIEYGSASVASFEAMLAAALAENPKSQVVVKIHPEVMAGRKRGHFHLAALRKNPRVVLLAEDVHPADLLPLVQRVYVVTSQMGFDALLWGVPVHCYGMPFYAGWGLTQDAIPRPDRRRDVGLLQLVYAALIAYPRYVDPETKTRCEVEVVLAHLALQRQCRTRLPEQLLAFGFSHWKLPIVRRFCQGSDVQMVQTLRDLRGAAVDCPMVVWGKKHDDLLANVPHPLIRVEDGFLRSVGLGADLIAPVSWVFDRRGIYFDATQPSDLELLLANAEIGQDLQLRAAQLRSRIVAAGLTKYNVGQAAWVRPAAASRVILVPGQVESDASIRYGAGEIRSNMALLRAVRAEQPNAYIVYKPHPDVLAGLRAQGQGEDEALRWCDEIVNDVAMADLLAQVDELHVLTSLSGFEALLRGLPVTVWGMPFYAGWGLTQDHIPCERRQRQRTLDELVAAALIMYPTYISRVSGRYTTPERALDELIAWRQCVPVGLPWWRKALRPLFGWFKK